MSSVVVRCFWFVVCLFMFLFCFFIFLLFVLFLFLSSFVGWFFDIYFFLSRIFLDFSSSFLQSSSHYSIKNYCVSMGQRSLISGQFPGIWFYNGYFLSSNISVCAFSFMSLRLALIFFSVLQ